MYIGPTGTIDEHMAQLVEQTSQTRPHQPPHHHLSSKTIVRTTHPPNLFAYPPRSRRGTNWGERRGHTGRIHMNAAYFQHRPPYSNTARRRPDTRRGCSRESTGSWSLSSGLVWGSTHLQLGLLVRKLIQRSEHGVRRALVGSEVGRPSPRGCGSVWS